MSATNDYWLQDMLYRAFRSTAQSSDSASVHKFGKYIHLPETQVLSLYEWDGMQLTDTIYDYRRLWPMPAADAPIHAQSWVHVLYHPDRSDNDLHRYI